MEVVVDDREVYVVLSLSKLLKLLLSRFTRSCARTHSPRVHSHTRACQNVFRIHSRHSFRIHSDIRIHSIHSFRIHVCPNVFLTCQKVFLTLLACQKVFLTLLTLAWVSLRQL